MQQSIITHQTMTALLFTRSVARSPLSVKVGNLWPQGDVVRAAA